MPGSAGWRPGYGLLSTSLSNRLSNVLRLGYGTTLGISSLLVSLLVSLLGLGNAHSHRCHHYCDQYKS